MRTGRRCIFLLGVGQDRRLDYRGVKSGLSGLLRLEEYPKLIAALIKPSKVLSRTRVPAQRIDIRVRMCNVGIARKLPATFSDSRSDPKPRIQSCRMKIRIPRGHDQALVLQSKGSCQMHRVEPPEGMTFC